MWLDNFRIEKGGDEAWSSSESGFSVRKSGRPVSSKGGWAEAGAEPANDGSGELRTFLLKNRIVCQVQNSLDLDRCSAMKALSTEPHRKVRQNAAERGRPEAKNLESIKGRLEPL